MPTFDECCVLIPSATLEDFPVKVSDSDACSMLAAWTVLWHPRLLSACEQIPTWYRADSPPEPTVPRMITVPTLSVEMLPDRYRVRCEQVEGGKWVTGTSRAEMLAALDLGTEPTAQTGKHRAIGVDDFYAAGFALLQIQIMTRRLRYTSNIDEIYLQGRAVAAAKAFLAGEADEAIDALHAFFDSLAEERDHYFSSDPHLIDLTLLTPSTLSSLLSSEELDPLPASPESAPSSLLSTPRNLLIDAETAVTIENDPSRYQSVRDALSSGQIGWAGGGPDATVALDMMTLSQAEQAVDEAIQKTIRAVGVRPHVFARYAGETPADLTGQLVRAGYVGMIPIDFAAGTGFGDESKVIRQAGGAQIESLTAKPMDAASSVSFMDLGPRLGEAIDSGEVATALLVHWPGRVCDTFNDLRRAASWTLALGRFWKLDDYFRDGERPYHHGNGRSATGDSALRLTERVQAGAVNPISDPATEFRRAIVAETDRRIDAMVGLVRGRVEENPNLTDASAFALASGANPQGDTKDSPSSQVSSAIMVVNPHDVAARQTVSIVGSPPNRGDHVFAATESGSGSDVTVDVPAIGFAVARGGGPTARKSLLKKLFGKSKLIANEWSLENEFMEVAISPKTGGIQGVYSGATRGNRFSLRLAVEPQLDANRKSEGEHDSHSMQCSDIRMIESTAAIGTIEAKGSVLDPTGKVLCQYKLRYSLCRGSRMVEVSGELSDVATLGDQPWKNYVALRAAVSSESSIQRVLLRDKIHRGNGRRLVAPLGVVIDEAERQTLIASGGLPFHRRVGDRYLDTLLMVRGETKQDFAMQYGFDVRSPVPTAKSIIAPASIVSISDAVKLPGRGWIIHTSPKEIMMNEIHLMQRNDGRLAALVRFLQTRSKPTTAVIRFCRDVAFAVPASASLQDVNWNTPIPAPAESEVTNESSNSKVLHVEKDSIRVPMSGHQVADILVVFQRET